MPCNSCCCKKSVKSDDSFIEPTPIYLLEDKKDCQEYQSCERINEFPYSWYPSSQNLVQIEYVRRLQCDFECLQNAFFALTSNYARMQFRLRQVFNASPNERDELLKELEAMTFSGVEEPNSEDELPRIRQDLRSFGGVRQKQALLIGEIRGRLTELFEESEKTESVSIPSSPQADFLFSSNEKVDEGRNSSPRNSMKANADGGVSSPRNSTKANADSEVPSPRNSTKANADGEVPSPRNSAKANGDGVEKVRDSKSTPSLKSTKESEASNKN